MEKPLHKKWWFWVFIAFIVIGVVGSPESGKEKPIYANAKDVDSHSGSGNVIGKISVIEARSVECTDEALIDWYTNYVSKSSGYSCYIILYTDKPNTGIYTSKGNIISKDVPLSEFAGYKDDWQMSGVGKDYRVENGELVEIK